MLASASPLHASELWRRNAEELLTLGGGIMQEYVSARAPFQDEAHLRAFVFDFLYSFARTLELWASRTRIEVEGVARPVARRKTAAGADHHHPGNGCATG